MPGAGDQPPGEDLLLLHLHQQDLLPPGLPHSALPALQTQEQVNVLLLVKNAAKFILYGPLLCNAAPDPGNKGRERLPHS